jgi:hypothetical protein
MKTVYSTLSQRFHYTFLSWYGNVMKRRVLEDVSTSQQEAKALQLPLRVVAVTRVLVLDD